MSLVTVRHSHRIFKPPEKRKVSLLQQQIYGSDTILAWISFLVLFFNNYSVGEYLSKRNEDEARYLRELQSPRIRARPLQLSHHTLPKSLLFST